MLSLDIWELTVWAIRDQKADRCDSQLFDVEHAWANTPRDRRTTDGSAAIERIGVIGSAIDGQGVISGLGARMHPDAEILADVLATLPWHQRSVITIQARLGEAPEWFHEQRKLLPLESEKQGPARHKVTARWMDDATVEKLREAGVSLLDTVGRRQFKEQESGRQYRWLEDGKRRQVQIRACPVEVRPTDDWVNSVNRNYDAWHEGMMLILCKLLSVKLKDHAIKGFRFPRRAN